jgi:hypothetical protein
LDKPLSRNFSVPPGPPGFIISTIYWPVGGFPWGGEPEGGVPDGRVPFIVPIPAGGEPEGGVPDGCVPFNSIPDGGVPEGPADWLTRAPSPAFTVWSGEVADDPPVGFSATAGVEDWGWVVGDTVVPVDCVVELSEFPMHPAQKIPATRIADTISMNILLVFMS